MTHQSIFHDQFVQNMIDDLKSVELPAVVTTTTADDTETEESSELPPPQLIQCLAALFTPPSSTSTTSINTIRVCENSILIVNFSLFYVLFIFVCLPLFVFIFFRT